jgi:hypothetical protein
LLDDPGELSSAERRALLADRQFRPAATHRSIVWALIAAKLGITTTTASAGAAVGAGAGAKISGAFGGAAIKWFGIGAVVGAAAGFGGKELLDTRRADEPRPGSVVVPSDVADASRSPAPQTRMKQVVEEKIEQAVPLALSLGNKPQRALSARTAAPATPDPASSRAHESRALDEARRVAQARAALRRGDAQAALAELGRLDADHPSGVLSQEREAIGIEAMMAVGQEATARERALRFLRNFPESPHAGRIRALVAN